MHFTWRITAVGSYLFFIVLGRWTTLILSCASLSLKLYALQSNQKANAPHIRVYVSLILWVGCSIWKGGSFLVCFEEIWIRSWCLRTNGSICRDKKTRHDFSPCLRMSRAPNPPCCPDNSFMDNLVRFLKMFLCGAFLANVLCWFLLLFIIYYFYFCKDYVLICIPK
jgi:hypothetical protein